MASVIPIKLTPNIILALFVLFFGVGLGFGKYFGGRSLREGFVAGIPICKNCEKKSVECTCDGVNAPNTALASRLVCPPCSSPDLTKYVLKSSIPPQQRCPDLTNYMLKTECPPTPDLSKYVLKSSIPKQNPVIIDNSSCMKDAGECPPCPRTRCPDVKCPAPTVCPAPAPCPRPVCPTSSVQCKTIPTSDSTVRPYLAPLSMSGFGLA
jgi:hypothetical protein